MKTLIENWNKFLLIEQTGVEKLIADPKKTEDFADAIADVSDPEQMKKVMTALLKNPEVKQAAQLFLNLKNDIEDEQAAKQENVIKDFGLGLDTLGQTVGAHINVLLSNENAQNIAKFGGPVAALGIIAAMLSMGGNPSLGLTNALSKLATAGTNSNQIMGGLEAALIAGAGALEEDEA